MANTRWVYENRCVKPQEGEPCGPGHRWMRVAQLLILTYHASANEPSVLFLLQLVLFGSRQCLCLFERGFAVEQIRPKPPRRNVIPIEILAGPTVWKSHFKTAAIRNGLMLNNSDAFCHPASLPMGSAMAVRKRARHLRRCQSREVLQNIPIRQGRGVM